MSRLCAYLNCYNKRFPQCGVSFYSFPVSEEERCKKWVKNSGNILLYGLSEEQLKNKVICEKHFHANQFRDARADKKRLIQQAVPTPININEGGDEVRGDELAESPKIITLKKQRCDRTYSSRMMIPREIFSSTSTARANSPTVSECSVLNILECPSPAKCDTPKKAKLKETVKRLKKTIAAERSRNYRLRSKLRSKRLTTKNILDNVLKNKAGTLKVLMNMQYFHGKNATWSSAEKDLALSLYYKSPSCYKFMRKNLQVTLPSPSTIKSWLKVFNLQTGFNTLLIKKLKLKVKTMETLERNCVVMVDEMSLKKGLSYNKFHDLIEGLEDWGSLGRTDNFADHALVFYLRGLLYSWKLPLCYFVTCGPMKAETLQKLIITSIETLFKIGLTPRILVSDQGTANVKAFKNLGVSKENPFFIQNTNKIYCAFDTPHLLKSLRNNFINRQNKIIVENKEVRWDDVVNTYEIDRKSVTARALIKLTPKHINPNPFEKMRVKFAVQIFSHSVFAAIMTAFKSKQLRSTTAVNTAEFIKKINNIFDALNSRIANDSNPYKCALSSYKHLAKNTLEEGLELFKEIKIFNVVKNKEKTNIVVCVNGFQWTIKAVLNLWKDLEEEGVKYLLTNRINQDALENFFSVVRNRGGYNPFPTVKEFRLAVQHNMNIRLQMPIENANCELDNSQLISWEELEGEGSGEPSKEEETEVTTSSLPRLEKVESSSSLPPHFLTIHQQPPMINQATLEISAVAYVAGYLVKYIVKKTKCETCRREMINVEANLTDKEMLIAFKDFSDKEDIKYLQRPSEILISIVHKSLEMFHDFYTENKSQTGFFEAIKTKIVKNIEETYPSWLNSISDCREHKMLLIRQLITIKLFRNLKWESQNLEKRRPQQKTNKKSAGCRKLKILEHS